MRNQAIKRKRIRTAAEKFADIVIQIIDAGLPAEKANPYFRVFDADGKPWPVPPWEMGREEILKFIRHRYGEQYAQWIAQAPQLTLH